MAVIVVGAHPFRGQNPPGTGTISVDIRGIDRSDPHADTRSCSVQMWYMSVGDGWLGDWDEIPF